MVNKFLFPLLGPRQGVRYDSRLPILYIICGANVESMKSRTHLGNVAHNPLNEQRWN